MLQHFISCSLGGNHYLVLGDEAGMAGKMKGQPCGPGHQAKKHKTQPWPHKVSLGDAGYLYDFVLHSPVDHHDKHVFSSAHGPLFQMKEDQHQACQRLHNLLCPRKHRSAIPIVLPWSNNLKEFNIDHRIPHQYLKRFKRSVELYDEQLWAFHASWRMSNLRRSTFNAMIMLEHRGDHARTHRVTMNDFIAQMRKAPWTRFQTQVCIHLLQADPLHTITLCVS